MSKSFKKFDGTKRRNPLENKAKLVRKQKREKMDLHTKLSHAQAEDIEKEFGDYDE